MASRLQDPRVSDLLDRLHHAAEDDAARSPSIPEGAQRLSAAARADAFEQVYMPISREAGVLFYQLVRAVRPAVAVEFGMSFAVSTIYLAAGIRDNRHGRLITTELSATKIQRGRANLQAAGVETVVDIREGDALETLRSDPPRIDLLLLDGWKEMYLLLLALLEPRLAPGALVLADDSSFDSVSEYVSYVRDPANGYESVSFPVEDGVEISCRVT